MLVGMEPLTAILALVAVVAVLAVPAALLFGLVWAAGILLSVAADGRATFVRPQA